MVANMAVTAFNVNTFSRTVLGMCYMRYVSFAKAYIYPKYVSTLTPCVNVGVVGSLQSLRKPDAKEIMADQIRAFSDCMALTAATECQPPQTPAITPVSWGYPCCSICLGLFRGTGDNQISMSKSKSCLGSVTDNVEARRRSFIKIAEIDKDCTLLCRT